MVKTKKSLNESYLKMWRNLQLAIENHHPTNWAALKELIAGWVTLPPPQAWGFAWNLDISL